MPTEQVLFLAVFALASLAGCEIVRFIAELVNRLEENDYG